MTTMSDTKPHIIQIVGYKNTGKTTLTAALIGHFTSMGLKVAAIKHDGHDHFEMDQEGTDSYRFGELGLRRWLLCQRNVLRLWSNRQPSWRIC